jgi:hypothetical protein
MPNRRFALLAAAVLGLASCRIEDRSPTGSRRDDAAIQRVLLEYHRSLAAHDWERARELVWRGATYAGIADGRSGGAGASNEILPLDSLFVRMGRPAAGTGHPDDIQIVRVDLRQQGDLATAWVTTRRAGAGAAGEGNWLEHFVLRRIGDGWRILGIARPSASAGRAS